MDYYKCIMGSHDDSFVSIFNRQWSRELESHTLNYKAASQMVSGNRLRPIIMAWGYYAGTDTANHMAIAERAVCIELIHKASILLDDWIDGDIARHGQKTFHVEYSNEEAVLYAIYLINKSLQLMSKIDRRVFDMLLETVGSMAYGGIREVSYKSMGDDAVQMVKEIINLETVSLIKNAFAIGYLTSGMVDMPAAVNNIGHYMGYCFQLLNDLEPFVYSQKNIEYKGGLNYDANKRRKNIVVAYLYGACTKKDRALLNEDADFGRIEQLVSKHKIVKLVLDEVSTYVRLISDSINEMQPLNISIKYMDGFRFFLHTMFSICFEKLGLSFTDKAFKD